MTVIWIKTAGYIFKVHSPLTWEECMDVCSRHFHPEAPGPEPKKKDT